MDAAVVGAGPAGLIAAERLATQGMRVTVFDRMRSPGRKFLLAGRSGLNLTHTEPLARFIGRYGPAAERLRPALEAWGPEALRAWSAGLGQPTTVGSSGRVFPAGWKASPLLRAWLRRLDSLGVRFRMQHRWQGWDGQGALLFDAPSGPVALRAGRTLLALGGASWPRTGPDGAWAAILAARGVKLEPLGPANCGVVCGWSAPFRERFEGAPLKRIAVTCGGETAQGEAVITRDGLEGGPIYALSRPIRAALAAGEAVLALDLRPDLDDAALARAMGGSAVSRANAWRRAGLSPAAAGLLRELGGAPKRALLPVRALAPIERAISTSGGVAWAALDATLRLRDLDGVFAAGEMLDWEAPTGGYLLQGCFSTGWLAAGSMAG